MVAGHRPDFRQSVKHTIAFLIALMLTPFASSRAGENFRPNIILIMADDFGYECVTANGGQSYQTPNLDKLAATGVRFENCHVQPLCTPTRVQLMTGRYNVRNYLNFGTLIRTETTFGHLFKTAGYRTGICGKWQLGREVDSPQHFGFDESCLWQHKRRPPRYANPGLEYNGIEKDFADGEYGPTLVNDFALDFITRHREQPFFLYYPMILTHSPFQPTPDSADWDPKTRSEKELQDVKYFADMTAYSPRQNADMTVRECAFNHNFKLYRTGEFFDLAADPEERNALQISALEVTPAAAATKLQSVLDQFRNARPRELDLQVEESTDQRKPAGKKKKKAE